MNKIVSIFTDINNRYYRDNKSLNDFLIFVRQFLQIFVTLNLIIRNHLATICC